METVWECVMRIGKWIFGGILSLVGLLSPLHILIVCVIVAIVIDFITGNIADYYRCKRVEDRYAFQSEKMWKTCWKMGLSIIGISFAWMLDIHVLSNLPVLNLANFFAGFIVGTELWSFLENAAIISDHPLFRALKKYMKEEVKNKTGIDYDDQNEQTL